RQRLVDPSQRALGLVGDVAIGIGGNLAGQIDGVAVDDDAAAAVIGVKTGDGHGKIPVELKCAPGGPQARSAAWPFKTAKPASRSAIRSSVSSSPIWRRNTCAPKPP